MEGHRLLARRGRASTCAQCHVPRGLAKELIADGPKAPGVFARFAHNHQMAAVDRAITDFPEIEAQKTAVAAELDKELQSALCVADFGADAAKIAILVDNFAAGHRWPSGAAQDRQLWFELRAYAGDKQVYQSGVVGDGIDPKEMPDDDIWLMRDCMFDRRAKIPTPFGKRRLTTSTRCPVSSRSIKRCRSFTFLTSSRIFPKPRR